MWIRWLQPGLRGCPILRALSSAVMRRSPVASGKPTSRYEPWGLGHNSFSLVPIYTRDSTLRGPVMRNPFSSGPSSGVWPMNILFVKCLRICSLILLPIWALQPTANADPVPVRSVQGTIHGFLELRSEDGQVVASGDSFQVVRGNRVTSRTVFHFKDGSIDDETTVFSQRRAFQLISDHRIQKGPSFPHPMEVLVDVPTGQVTVHSTGKDGKEEVKTDHLDLPLDLANGIVPVILENLPPNSPAATVSMVVATPKPRLVKLVISNVGDDTCFVAGSPRKAIHYNIKINLGGVTGVVAPLIGKAPPDIQIWTIGGEATTFARERGPLYPEGPMMTIQLVSPTWPDAPQPGH
jgi:hypothetical protein